MSMRHMFGFALGAFGLCGLAAATAQEGAVVRSPFSDPPPMQAPAAKSAPTQPIATTRNPAMPDYLRNIFPDAAPVSPADPGARRSIAYEEIPDINRDLQVSPAAGNWLIMVISYPGKDGATQARKMCLELREKNRVPAYIFVYGAEERRKEYERVKKIVDQQQAFFKQNGLSPDQPLRIRHQQIDVQHAVLIGGYADDEAAKKALGEVRKWQQPDEKRVDLEVKVYEQIDPNDARKNKKEMIYVNPFKRAFVCRNPSVKADAPQEQKIDVAALRRMNADEPLSLFNCKKSYTLAVKEFQTPYMMHDRATSSSIWDKIAGSAKAEHPDGAKISSHNLAESLRKLKYNGSFILQDTYVLHAKFSSTVTVGGFDSPDDPALKHMQEFLAKRLNEPPFTQIQFFYRPVPMAVPR